VTQPSRYLVLVSLAFLPHSSAAGSRLLASSGICPAFLTTRTPWAAKTSIAEALFSRGYEAGDRESVTVARLGPPSGRRAETVNSLQSAAVDSIIRLRYPGLEVTFDKTTDGGKELLGAVTLTSRRCEVYPGLSVGASAITLRRVFGAPTVQSVVADSTIMQYEAVKGPVYSYLNFTVVRDTIRVIQWQFGID